jgi:hypothetical protein
MFGLLSASSTGFATSPRIDIKGAPKAGGYASNRINRKTDIFISMMDIGTISLLYPIEATFF